jgi:hypothetical protein
MWTMRLRRTGSARGQRAALPTVAAFAHIPTPFDHKEGKDEPRKNDIHRLGNIPS